MADNTQAVDTLSIEVEATSEEAAKHIRDLATSLKTLKSSLTGKGGSGLEALAKDLKALNDPSVAKTTTNLKRLSAALQNLKAVGKINLSKVVPDNLGTKMKEITDSVEGISNESISKLNDLTNALKNLAGVELRNIGSAVKNVSNATTTAVASATGGEAAKPEAVNVDTKQAEQKINGLRAALAKLKDAASNSNFLSGLTTQLDAAKNKVLALFKPLKDVVKTKVHNMFTAPIRGVQEFNAKLDKTVAAFKRVMFYRVIRTALKEIADAFKTGINNVYEYSRAFDGNFAQSLDRASTALLYFKNSLGASLAPLVNAIVPYLDAIIDKVVEVINVINQLFAKLTGASTWTKAIKYPKAYADATKKAGSAAKEALRYLAPFDELNVLPSDRGSGSGGGAGGMDYSSMFEEMPVTEIGGKLGEIFDVFRKAWENEGQNTIDAIRNAFESLRLLGQSVGNSFFEVFTNGTGQKTIETILRIVQNVAETVGGLADRFREAWDEAGTGTAIIQHLWDGLNDILGFWERITKATSDWVQTLNLSPLLSSFEGLTGSLEKLLASVLNLFGDVFESLVLPALKWVIETALPKVLDLISRVAEIVGNFFSVLSGDMTLKEFFDSLSTGEIIVSGLVLGIGGLITAFTAIVGVTPVVMTAVRGLGTAFGFITSPIGNIGNCRRSHRYCLACQALGRCCQVHPGI